ncbi:MAG: HAD hydrolase family protein [Candidatus Eisenbacteria bacterium]|nr:HAD hydrolase family protein [Candidatus Eisenbacteria bacterium]
MTIGVLALDVDGVLTDGGLYLSGLGEEMLRFGVLDGLGITRWLQTGRLCVWVSARSSPAAAVRAERLGVKHLLFGVHDKASALESFLGEHGYTWADVAYMGDDLVDMEPVMRAGLGIAVANAVAEVRDAARYVTVASGGAGAVREVVDMLLGSDTRPFHETTQEADAGSRGSCRTPAGRHRSRTP